MSWVTSFSVSLSLSSAALLNATIRTPKISNAHFNPRAKRIKVNIALGSTNVRTWYNGKQNIFGICRQHTITLEIWILMCTSLKNCLRRNSRLFNSGSQVKCLSTRCGYLDTRFNSEATPVYPQANSGNLMSTHDFQFLWGLVLIGTDCAMYFSRLVVSFC